MLSSSMVSREVSMLLVLVTSGEARGPGLQSRRGPKNECFKRKQCGLLRSEMLNY
jgi:hypothetical protein